MPQAWASVRVIAELLEPVDHRARTSSISQEF
jgi:hypothetical protein